MSTEIKGLYGSVIGISSGAGLGNVFVYLPNASVSCKDAGAPRADFLAAVATECNVLVIDQAELPEVTVDSDGNLLAGWRLVCPEGSPAGLRIDAMQSLALAEYLDAHPPVQIVDEAQVAAIGAAILTEDKSLGRHGDTTLSQYDDIARSLYRAGIRIEVKR
ncbi:MAG: hypothetical protein ACOH10_12570 [Rhodoglobus sp.]